MNVKRCKNERKGSREKIPWSGEFTFRIDPCAGLIASSGSLHPMVLHNSLPVDYRLSEKGNEKGQG